MMLQVTCTLLVELDRIEQSRACKQIIKQTPPLSSAYPAMSSCWDVLGICYMYIRQQHIGCNYEIWFLLSHVKLLEDLDLG